MLFFASGVFSGWKHETFGGCFLDYAWLVQEELPQSPVYYGGGGKKPITSEERTRLFREHHEYLDGLREIQVQIADGARGARTIAMRADMAAPHAVLPPSMRGTVPPTRVADVSGDPFILAALALLIDEVDD